MRQNIPVLELQNKFTIRMPSKPTHIDSLLPKTLWQWFYSFWQQNIDILLDLLLDRLGTWTRNKYQP